MAIGWVFPTFADKYAAQGGPTWTLFLLLVAGAVAYALGSGRRVSQFIASGLILFAIGLGLTFTVITWIHGADTSRGAIEEAQQRAQAEAERPLLLARQQQEAEAARIKAAGGPQCMDVVHKDQFFGTMPSQSPVQNPDGTCYFEFTPPSDVCFYMEGRWSRERSGPFGGCREAIPFSPDNVPRDIVRVWSAGQPFRADYTLRPRTSRHAIVQ